MAKTTKAEQLAAAAGVSPANEGVSPDGGAPLGVEGTKVTEATQKGDLAVAAEPVTEGAPGAIIEQRKDEELPPQIPADTEPEEAPAGDVVDAGGRVLARVVKGSFTVWDGVRMFTAWKGEQIKTTRAEVDRGVRLGFLEE